MVSVATQRDLILEFKKETCLNVGILSKMQSMPLELTKIFKENALDKPTQNLFNHLTHYLISVIDLQVCAAMPWPLFDTKTERSYRNEVSSFINEYSAKGLLSPIMSSYLVNPGCYKVTLLLFQLSQLAVQKILKVKMKDSQKILYNDMADKYKSEDKVIFMGRVEKETENMSSKLTNHFYKRKAMENVAKKMCKKISEMESTLTKVNAQKYLDELVDGFINKNVVDDIAKLKINQIKNVKKPAPFFDDWLAEVDKNISKMELKWNEKVTPFLELCRNTQVSTQSLISRHTGEADKDTYMIEYNHQVDEICTKELQNQVNSQQKFILKNIVKDEQLDFPNLIRGFLIAISFILKNAEIGDEVYKFNEYLEGGEQNYKEMVKTMKDLVVRVMNAESKLQPSPLPYHRSIALDIPEIPPLPDLSCLFNTREQTCQALFDAFTPLSKSKHQFNLQRKLNFAHPQKEFITPFFKPKEFRSLISIHSFERPDNFHNISIISKCDNKVNETIAECSTGFTKQQIQRLLATKKCSSKKKSYRTERPNVVTKVALFNEPNSSTESLIRSYSSPNLFENRERRNQIRAERRKLSIMEENSPISLDVSGIYALDKDSFEATQRVNAAGKLDLNSSNSLPLITITDSDQFRNKIKDFKTFNSDALIDTPKEIETKSETPKNSQIVHKTSSLEKIINRFKKVRASVVPEVEKGAESLTVIEERENLNENVRFTANRVLLPDLLSPSSCLLKQYDELNIDLDNKVVRKPRESLGTMLGVDQTFLDQFDLIDD